MRSHVSRDTSSVPCNFCWILIIVSPTCRCVKNVFFRLLGFSSPTFLDAIKKRVKPWRRARRLGRVLLSFESRYRGARFGPISTLARYLHPSPLRWPFLLALRFFRPFYAPTLCRLFGEYKKKKGCIQLYLEYHNAVVGKKAVSHFRHAFPLFRIPGWTGNFRLK